MTEKEPHKPTSDEIGAAEGMMSVAERASSQIREQLLGKYRELGFDEKTVDEFVHSAKAFHDEGIDFNVGGHAISIWRGSSAKGIREETQKVMDGGKGNFGPYGIGVRIDGEELPDGQATKVLTKYGPLVVPFLDLQRSSILNSPAVQEKAKDIAVDDLLK